jgi:hypothetical protein
VALFLMAEPNTVATPVGAVWQYTCTSDQDSGCIVEVGSGAGARAWSVCGGTFAASGLCAIEAPPGWGNEG